MRAAAARGAPVSRLAAGTLAPTIGVIGFLTLVDLFAAQAILPALVETYRVSPAAMGFAVNAGTLGMAVAALCITLLASRIDRRKGIWMSLALLSLPTLMLAIAPDLATFTCLRVVQGLFMASAFTLTMTWLAENLGPAETQRALAAYITGVVASNVVGRLVTALVADMAGLPASFVLLAILNLAGAFIVVARLRSAGMMAGPISPASPIGGWRAHLAAGNMRAAFAIGFLILFAFIGTFSYVNFVLVGAPISLGAMSLGLVYLVFVPSLVTTPLTGALAARFGSSRTTESSLLAALAGLPLMLFGRLPFVLAGMALVAAGTFLAQAAVTGFVSRAATSERAAASGLYLASYYIGGLTGALVLGQIFDAAGWTATVAGIAVALGIAIALAGRLVVKEAG